MGRGLVEPNPMVGAVLVREAPGGPQIVAEGWHREFGRPHAEVEALRDAQRKGVDPAGLTMVVTLEPCSHFGKTPPCADALVAAKVGRVVAAMQDPFPEVAGRGFARLREAGINVVTGVCEAEARRLNEAWIKRVTTGLPWVIAKWAQTVDGKIATSTGDSKWISGEDSRRRVHELRARVDAVLVGIGTALADDPQLTARGVEVKRVARRVVLDPTLRLPPDAKLLNDNGPPVTVAYKHKDDSALSRRRAELERLGVEAFPLTNWCGRRLDLAPLLKHLAQTHAATNVLVEGGAGLLGAVFEQRLVDQALVFVAPKLTGDPEALDPVAGSPCEVIADAVRLELRSLDRIGEDVLLDYRVGPS